MLSSSLNTLIIVINVSLSLSTGPNTTREPIGITLLSGLSDLVAEFFGTT